MNRLPLLILPAVLALSACEQVNQRLGLDDPAKKEARQDAEGRAVGSACRQSGRAIEDCYSVYYWLPKASIFAGWREMNDYMLSNKLEIVQPKFEPPLSPDDMKKRRQQQAKAEAAAKAEAGAKAEAEAKGAEAGGEAATKPGAAAAEAKAPAAEAKH